jgi:alpha-beta hydrolase superfamily lysophospholipase
MGREREVEGFVLSSPFFGFAIRPPILKVLGARLVGTVIPWLPVATGIAFDALTSDEELQGWTARDHLYSRSTTPRWFVEAKRAHAEVLGRAAEFKGRLLVLAGGGDSIADLGATRRFMDSVGSPEKRLVVYDGFRHEIFNERERARPIGEAVAWLARHVG